MQNSNSLGEYREIRAPQQLRERVFASCEELSKSGNITKLNITKISSAAACFVAVFALVLTMALSGASPKLSHGSENIGRNAVVVSAEETALASARTSLPSGLRFELDISSPSVIKVSGGTVHLVDSETYEHLASGSAVYAERDALLIWDVSDEIFDELTLCITSSGSERCFVLSFDENGDLYISKSK